MDASEFFLLLTLLHVVGLTTVIYQDTISFMTETESKLCVFHVEATSSRREQTPLDPAVSP